MTIRTLLRRLDQFRRDHTQGFGKGFYRWLGRDRCLIPERIAPSDTRKILVLRNNKRIGNMYFMLPFLHELRRAYPKATIDLMLIDGKQAMIFEHAGIDQVLISQFAFKTAGAFCRAIHQCRQTVYDLLLMPHASASDTLIGGLLHARNKVAFHGDRTSAVYPHSFDITPSRPHAAHSALTLLEALGHTVQAVPDHRMTLTAEEIERGQAVVKALRGSAVHCFAYFRGARGNKVITNDQWQRIRQGFDRAVVSPICWVEILSPDITAPLTPGTTAFGSADLRHLAAVLRAFDLFICGDTGPLHLADAADARCVGLFTATQTQHYGCLGQRTIDVIDINTLNPTDILRTLGLNPAATGALP